MEQQQLPLQYAFSYTSPSHFLSLLVLSFGMILSRFHLPTPLSLFTASPTFYMVVNKLHNIVVEQEMYVDIHACQYVTLPANNGMLSVFMLQMFL